MCVGGGELHNGSYRQSMHYVTLTHTDHCWLGSGQVSYDMPLLFIEVDIFLLVSTIFCLPFFTYRGRKYVSLNLYVILSCFALAPVFLQNFWNTLIRYCTVSSTTNTIAHRPCVILKHNAKPLKSRLSLTIGLSFVLIFSRKPNGNFWKCAKNWEFQFLFQNKSYFSWSPTSLCKI